MHIIILHISRCHHKTIQTAKGFSYLQRNKPFFPSVTKSLVHRIILMDPNKKRASFQSSHKFNFSINNFFSYDLNKIGYINIIILIFFSVNKI